jgi:hypothetical protein
VMIAAAGLLVGQDPRKMIETAIALGVAAMPEGLPIVGHHRPGARHALDGPAQCAHQ